MTPVSLNMARTAIGSVAEISTPKTIPAAAGQAKNCIIPTATTNAEMTTPSVDSTTTGSMSRRSSRQRILSAASNKRGGRMTSKMKSCVSIAPVSSPVTAKAMPVSTSPPCRQAHAPGDNGDQNRHDEEADGVNENGVHRWDYRAARSHS